MKKITTKVICILIICLTILNILTNSVKATSDIPPGSPFSGNPTFESPWSGNPTFESPWSGNPTFESPLTQNSNPDTTNSQSKSTETDQDVDTDDEAFEETDSLLGEVVDTIAGILVYPLKLLIVGIAGAAQGITTLIGSMGDDDIQGWLTPDDLFFNRLSLTNINFFDIDNSSGAVKSIRTNVATWYYSLRLLAIAILLLILIYIGIRMATSTVASDKAVYKHMLKDWFVSFALVFLLHYIIILVLQANDSLISLFASSNDSSIESAASSLVEKSFGLSFTRGLGSAIVYAFLVGMTMAFLFTYIKRMLTVGFLILIAPIITITYSIDKVGDQKSQALNTWLKEFMFNVLIQPFHILVYLVFVGVSLDLLSSDSSSIAAAVLAIMCMKFIFTAEDIVKKIFGFDQASSLGKTIAGLAAVTAAGSLIKNTASGMAKAGGAIKDSKVGKAISNSRVANNIKNSKVGIGASKVSSGVSKVANKVSNSTVGKVTKAMLPSAVGIAAASISGGANTGTALATGKQASDIVSGIQKSMDEKKEKANDVKKSENKANNTIEKYAEKNGMKDFRTDNTQKTQLFNDIQKLMNTDMKILETNLQKALSDFATSKGIDVNTVDGAEQLSNEYSRLADEDVSTLTDPNEKNLAQAIQNRNMALTMVNLRGSYEQSGYTDPGQAVDSFLDDVKDDKFKEWDV